MKVILIILVLIAFASVEAQKKQKKNKDFLRWKNKYRKDKWGSKDSASLERRAKGVLKRKQKCEDINGQGLTWTCGSNEYDHLSSEEVEARLLGGNIDPPPVMEPRSLPTEITPILTYGIQPSTLDMSSSCPPVLNQGACNSCWAFAALTTIECWRKRNNLPDIRFSPQFLIDCDTRNNKCISGSASNVFRSFLLSLGPNCPTLADYPYTSGNYNKSNPGTFTCQNTPKYPVGFTKDYRITVNGNETLMKTILNNHGPVAIPMFWGNAMRSYKSGIFYDPLCPVATATVPQCDGKNINHLMVLTGYDVINNIPVWKIRNSWGTSWGMNGYGYIVRNATNNCNIACRADYVTN